MKFLPATVEDITDILFLLHGDSDEDTTSKLAIDDELREAHRTCHRPETIREGINQPNSTFLKCVNEKGDLIGCVQGVHKGENLAVGCLSVSPSAQGLGVGISLMNKMEEKARELKCRKVTLSVACFREQVVKWYEKRGFVKAGGKKPYHLNEGIAIDVFDMEKKI